MNRKCACMRLQLVRMHYEFDMCNHSGWWTTVNRTMLLWHDIVTIFWPKVQFFQKENGVEQPASTRTKPHLGATFLTERMWFSLEFGIWFLYIIMLSFLQEKIHMLLVVCKTLNNDPSCMEWLYQVITSHVLHSVTHWDNKASLHPIIQTRQEWNISDIAKFSPAQSNFNLVC